jgi:sugar-specific transcriptional regulator TrmB
MERRALPLRDEDILVLNKAGLNALQAKIYLTLSMGGKQSIKSVAKAAFIDRSNAYREILNLQEMGLVEKTIGIPNLFEAVPLQDGIAILLSRKEEEYKEIKEKTELLIEQSRCLTSEVIEEQEKDFHIIPKKTIFIKDALINIQIAQWSNDTISSLKRFSQAMMYSFETHKRALARGVKTRVIVEKPEKGQLLPEAIQNLIAHPNFELRYTSTLPKTLGACFDNKSVGILVDPSASVTESACFNTNHPSFVELFQNYFEKLWCTAEKANLEDNRGPCEQ